MHRCKISVPIQYPNISILNTTFIVAYTFILSSSWCTVDLYNDRTLTLDAET